MKKAASKQKRRTWILRFGQGVEKETRNFKKAPSRGQIRKYVGLQICTRRENAKNKGSLKCEEWTSLSLKFWIQSPKGGRRTMERINVTVRARPLSPEDAKTSPWRISGNSIAFSNHSSKFDFGTFLLLSSPLCFLWLVA